jgi:lipopolysaccharide/colanic/teichoic acid biosynthesis glycosyltransferase
MKPGITGLWRFIDTSYNDLVKEKVELDLEYIDNWSLMLDFKIAIKTVSTVLSGTGM